MELRTDVYNLGVGRSICGPGSSRSPRRSILRVGDIMSKDVVTAALDATIFSIAQQMSEQSISCVVVTDKDRVVGVLTEKDMLNSVAGRDTEFHRLRVSERMSSPVDTIAPEVSVFEADQMMEAKCIRRLPVVEDGRLVGIVTQTDITRALISLQALCCVSDIMTKHVATVHVDATAVEAARIMSCSNISCLVATDGEKIAGILTEKDLLKRVVALHRDPTQIRVVDIMSLPVVTIPPTCSILSASKKMEAMHFHRLLIADDKAICGIVTQTDIMRAVRSSSEAAESHQRALEMELVDLLQHAIRDLQRVRGFLDGIPNLPPKDGTPADAATPATPQTVSGAFSSPSAS